MLGAHSHGGNSYKYKLHKYVGTMVTVVAAPSNTLISGEDDLTGSP